MAKTEEKKKKLNPRQELFCKLYASDKEFFGNGVQAYIEAYDINLSQPGAYASARTRASELLTNVNILARIDEYLEDLVLNDQHVDKQLAFWITQKASPQASVAALKEYNALKQRITKKLEVSGHLEIQQVIKEFLDDVNDDAYDEASAISPPADEPDSGDEVAEAS